MAWFWLAVAFAATPLAVASLRGRWLIAAVPFAAFVWGFGQVVLAEEPALRFNLVWLLALVGLEAVLAVPPTAESWWVARYQSWTGWKNNLGGVMAVLVAAWIALIAIPALGALATLAVVGGAVLILAVSVGSAISAFVTKSRPAEMRAITAGSAALPVVVVAYAARSFVFGF